MHVVICGGGVIGACTARFLARRGVEVTVVEQTGVACAASGKAGGFLALDWCAGSPLDALARRSFALHAELAGEPGADWAYRRMNAYSGLVVRDGHARGHAPAALPWLSRGTVISHRIGTPDPAQIAPHPDAIERLRAICERLSPAFTPERIIAQQACFRPVTREYLPLIGHVPRIEGAYIATGHNVWGILNAPATGEAMAELIVDGEARIVIVDLTPFDPARLPPSAPILRQPG